MRRAFRRPGEAEAGCSCSAPECSPQLDGCRSVFWHRSQGWAWNPCGQTLKRLMVNGDAMLMIHN